MRSYMEDRRHEQDSDEVVLTMNTARNLAMAEMAASAASSRVVSRMSSPQRPKAQRALQVRAPRAHKHTHTRHVHTSWTARALPESAGGSCESVRVG